MKFQFKFSKGATSEDREQLLASLSDDGADNVEPMFPDSDEVELARFYRVRAADPAGKKLLRRLKRSSAVEYAEIQPERHLIMPIELERQLNGKPSRAAASRRKTRRRRVS